jgi:hypothetical protein
LAVNETRQIRAPFSPVFCGSVAAVVVAFEIFSAARDATSVVAPYAEETASAAWPAVREAVSPTAADACRTASATCAAVPAATFAVLLTEELAVSRTASPTCSAPCIAVRKIDFRPPPPKRDVPLPPMNIQSTPIPIKAAEMGFSRTASWSAIPMALIMRRSRPGTVAASVCVRSNVGHGYTCSFAAATSR